MLAKVTGSTIKERSRRDDAGVERRDTRDKHLLKTPPALVEHFFRHEYGRLVTVLARKVGVRNIELVEDAVQAALTSALTSWTMHGLPDRPSAWLYRVAHNELIGELRQRAGRLHILEEAAIELAGEPEPPADALFDHEIRDDMLRMLFICCDEAIPRESQLVLALKTLCGFSTSEIALRLFTSEENVHKRLSRGRTRLREMPIDMETPALVTLQSRLPGVHEVLYLLFNEGYLSAHAEFAIRRELCDEALRLTTLLAEHSVGARPETFALLALMHLHTARLVARVDGAGGLLLLEEQDRSLWDREQMNRRRRMAGTIGKRRGVLTLPCRSGHRIRTLPCVLIRADPMARDRRSLLDPRAGRTFTSAYS